jgi:hypothetical protein
VLKLNRDHIVLRSYVGGLMKSFERKAAKFTVAGAIDFKPPDDEHRLVQPRSVYTPQHKHRRVIACLLIT